MGLVRGLFDATGAGWHYAKEMRAWLEAEGAVDVDKCVVDMGFGANSKDANLANLSSRCTAKAMDGLVKHAKCTLNPIARGLYSLTMIMP